MENKNEMSEVSSESACSPASRKQMHLPFLETHSERVLVRLSPDDLSYREVCVDTDKDFSWGFLMMTRAQRLGATVQCLESMLAYERNRELAEESLIMRRLEWATCPPALINWSKIACVARNAAQIRANDFAEFQRLRGTLVQ